MEERQRMSEKIRGLGGILYLNRSLAFGRGKDASSFVTGEEGYVGPGRYVGLVGGGWQSSCLLLQKI